ncbi:DnaB-like helicase C-terminal domain-containing protein [Candidatus Peribacteria bacterium]|nr:DnaB-like helicase C-terminal domain-containing protein [Candidatus Peribacteria bacterium]
MPIIALSQLSRAVESRASKEPILSDLRESGSIEQDADIVLMIYREEYYNNAEMQESDMNKGKTTIFIRKNRNGPVGNAEFIFDGKFMKFREIDTTRVGF